MTAEAMQKFKLIPLILMSLNLLSCGKKGDSWVYAISPGNYSLTGPFCVSTGKSPLYDSVAKSVNLFDFSGVTTNELRFVESGVQRIIASNSCKMTVKHKVQENKNNIFALQLARSFIFEPAECILQAAIGATIYNVSSSSTSVLQDSDAKGSDIPFEITQVGINLEMTSINRDALNSVWADYGCASPDRIKWILVPLTPN
jgi:hypothetical protein